MTLSTSEVTFFALDQGARLQICNINTCDAIQQKVHTVGKLVFSDAVKIGRGDHKEH